MPIKYSVEISKTAEEDFEKIWSYIAQDSPNRASQFVKELEKQAKTLERFPLRCPLIPENEFLHTNYRHLIYRKYRTIFRIRNKIVYVMRIIHGSQLLDSSNLKENLTRIGTQ